MLPQKEFSSLFHTIGLVTFIVFTARVCWVFFSWVWKYLISRYLYPIDYKAFGEWAVVTGSTDGIGKGYAFELARRGMNIVLISRSEEKLKKTAAEILREHENIQVKAVTADFSRSDIYENIRNSLDSLDIGVLVNNVGMLFKECPQLYHLVKDGEAQTEMISVNCVSMHRMTWMILPRMVAKRKGIVINMSSIAGYGPLPKISLYAGTKAFITNFTESLYHEYTSKGVIFKCITPGVVASNMTEVGPHGLLVPSSAVFARSNLDMLDKTGVVTPGYWPHNFIVSTLKTVPNWILGPLLNYLFEKIRLEKLAREKATQ